jgi:GNAT superfamily N-acetyltransferase
MASAPSFEIISDPRQSWIRGTLDRSEVTRASFKECDDPYRRELIQVDTAPEHQRQGYALALLRYLERAEPRGPLIDSPEGMNTEAGLATIAAARRHGIAIHEFGCFRGGKGCDCAIGS